MRWSSQMLVSCSLILSLSGCGSDDSGDGGTPSTPSTVPTDITAEGFTAFMDGGKYKENGWISESAAPRDQATGSVHGRVRVWLNPEAVEAQAAAAMPIDTEYGVGSMAVKEFYDATDQLVGHAALLKVDAPKAPASWQFYCKAPDGRCTSDTTGVATTPLFEKGGTRCGSCHGLGVVTRAP